MIPTELEEWWKHYDRFDHNQVYFFSQSRKTLSLRNNKGEKSSSFLVQKKEAAETTKQENVWNNVIVFGERVYSSLGLAFISAVDDNNKCSRGLYSWFLSEC